VDVRELLVLTALAESNRSGCRCGTCCIRAQYLTAPQPTTRSLSGTVRPI